MVDINANITNTRNGPRDGLLAAVVNPDGTLLTTELAAEWSALQAGRAFLASVGGSNLTAGQEIYLTIANPADSGRTLFITNRLFGAFADAADRLEYVAYSNPTAVLTTVGTPVNRDVSLQASAPSVAGFRYQIAAQGSITMGGVTGSSNPIRRDGGIDPRRLSVEVAAGQILGFSVRGAGQNLSQSARVYVTLEWFELLTP